MKIKIIFCSIIFIILGCKKPLDPKSDQNSDLPQTSTKLEIEWDKSFGGTEDDNAKCMTKTLEGDLIIGGNSRSSKGSGNKDSFYLGYENFWVIKIDKNGNKIFDRSYSINSKNHKIYKIISSQDGGYILAGEVWGEYGEVTVLIIKLDSKGVIQWDFNAKVDSFQLFFTDVLEKKNGDLVLVSNSEEGIGQTRSNLIMGISKNGIKNWQKTFIGLGTLSNSRIFEDDDLSLVLVGITQKISLDDNGYIIDKGPEKLFFIKIDENGNEKFAKMLIGNGNFGEQLSTVIKRSNKNFLAIYSDVNQNNNFLEFSNTGEIKLQKKIASKDYHAGRILELENGQVLQVTGFILPEISISVFSKTLDLITNKSFRGGEGEVYPIDALQLNQKIYIISNSSQNIGNNKKANFYGGIDYWLMKLK